MENVKKPWQSKTNWVALIVAVSAFIPNIQKLIVENPEAFSMAIGGVFALLRQVTKDRIVIK